MDVRGYKFARTKSCGDRRPVVQFASGAFFAAIVWAVGYPVSEGDSTTVIGYVLPDSPAQKVGLQPGDKILSVDGKPVRRFMGMNDSVSWDVVRSEGDKIAVKFERDGKVQTVWVEPYKAETRGWRRQSVRQLLIYPAETPIIDKVEPNTLPRGRTTFRRHRSRVQSNQSTIRSHCWNTSATLNDKLVLHVERGGQS